MTKPARCPWCGADPVVSEEETMVFCKNYDCEKRPEVTDDYVDDAVSKWNRKSEEIKRLIALEVL